MGSFVEINDTLQITKEQGFPQELDLTSHLQKPFSVSGFKDKIYEFKDKNDIRIYQIAPVRVFLVENIEGKWLYWGLIEILELKLDYLKKKTSGKFRITKLFIPDEMKQAFGLIDNRPEFNYFKE
jgi:hypothetical protein